MQLFCEDMHQSLLESKAWRHSVWIWKHFFVSSLPSCKSLCRGNFIGYIFRSTLCLLQFLIIELKKIKLRLIRALKKLPKFYFLYFKADIEKLDIFQKSDIFKKYHTVSSIRVSRIHPLKHSKLVVSNDSSHLVKKAELSFGVWLSSLDDSGC